MYSEAFSKSSSIFIFMLRVLSVCLSVVLVGVFLTYYGRVAAFLVGLLFSFV